MKNVFCGFCGTRFTEQKVYPRKCFKCYEDTYNSPLPVVIVMIPVREDFSCSAGNGVRYGQLIQKRNIEPGKGEWAITGGFVDEKETWQHAAMREVYEELGKETKETDYKLYDIVSNTDKSKILIFCAYNSFLDSKDDCIKKFVPNSEVLEVGIMFKETPLAFDAHTIQANKFLGELNHY